MRITETVECPVFDSFRVQQIAGLFDVPIAEKVRQTFSVELPDSSEEWSIGAIVGPSGSGKSTIARKAFGQSLYGGNPWPADKAVVDCFGESSIRQITHMLTAVGFSSPPSWLKPYHVLSNGEKFRCDLAKALTSEGGLVAFDEFSSLVDRTVAKIGSAAIARSIRGGKISSRFVAVTCHYDIIEWLEPDWVLDLGTATLARGRVQRPQIRLEVFRCEHEAWKLFAPHHYMSADLHQGAGCYLALWEGQPVAFCAIQANFGWRNARRISRVVVLPDYQGVGIGVKLAEAVAQMHVDRGNTVSITFSHPAMIAHCTHSPLWRFMRTNKTGGRHHGSVLASGKRRTVSIGRAVMAFEYVGAARATPARSEACG